MSPASITTRGSASSTIRICSHSLHGSTQAVKRESRSRETCLAVPLVSKFSASMPRTHGRSSHTVSSGLWTKPAKNAGRAHATLTSFRSSMGLGTKMLQLAVFVAVGWIPCCTVLTTAQDRGCPLEQVRAARRKAAADTAQPAALSCERRLRRLCKDALRQACRF